MKFNKIYNAWVGTALILPLVLATSCKKDFLNTAPKTNLPIEQAFSSPARILSQVNGMYSGLKSGQFYGGRYLIYNDIRGEEFVVNKPNGVTGLDTWRHNLTSNTNEVVNLWTAAYVAINRANLVLEGLDVNASVLTPALATQYKGEAKFTRAMAYYGLLQLYAKPFTLDNGASAGVPLRIRAEKDLSGNDLARSTVAEIYAQILKDLNEAENELALTLTSTRASKNTAIALKTRVYLSMGNYAKVVEEANKIVSLTAPFKASTGNLYQLESNISTVFGGNYTGAESVLFFPMTDLDNPGTQNQLAFYYNVQTSGGNQEYFLNPAGILANPVFAAGSTDVRKSLITAVGTNNYLTKFKRPSPYTDYVPVMRYAEVLLNLAEASVKTGDLVRAVALVTAVRQRSNPGFVFAPTELATPAALINTILTERRIEFLGEGLRSPDLLRLNMTIPAKAGSQGSAQAVAPTSPAYIWPISSLEIQNNKLMTPN